MKRRQGLHFLERFTGEDSGARDQVAVDINNRAAPAQPDLREVYRPSPQNA
ncbi:MAG: hypothetical protein JO025_05600 [Verrucomicrobia bacterium]|nr:hypothetical protein [Verrucomicrobiota bacterium]